MAISLTPADFKGVGQVATHCDLPKLNIAIEQAIEFDLGPILCNLFGLVDAEWRQNEGPIKDLVCGSTYKNCGGYDTKHAGLRKVLVYFAYARYRVINAENDTPNGAVTKQNDWSIPKPLAEIKAMSSMYKNMGAVTMEKVEAFIYKNIENYPGYNLNNKKGCGCNGSCGTKTNTRSFGFSSKTIRK